MTGYDVALVDGVRAAIGSAGDAERAETQQRYMKSAMPYRGITSPQLRALLRPELRAHPPTDRATWEASVRELWDGAQFREERYAALAVARHRAARGWLDPDALPMLHHLVVTGAWWDLVDETAAHLVGPVLLEHRAKVTPVMDRWAQADNLWVRRTAILSQLTHKEATDAALLERCVLTNLEGSPYGHEFFVRKALGWALREHAKTDPAWVLDLVDRESRRMSWLTRREAMKHLGR